MVSGGPKETAFSGNAKVQVQAMGEMFWSTVGEHLLFWRRKLSMNSTAALMYRE